MPNTKTSKYSKTISKEELNKIVEAEQAKLQEFIKQGRYKDFLLTIGNLGKYSFINQMYLLAQNPDVKTVMGMRGWNHIGRSIIPGSKALRVVAPLRTTQEVLLVDKDGNPILDDQGKQVTKTEQTVKGYTFNYVFDISQTTGRELYQFKVNDGTPVDEYEVVMDAISAVANDAGYAIEFVSQDELGQGCSGLCNYQTMKIKILDGMTQADTLSVLVHETAHGLAHNPFKPKFEGITYLPTRDIKEVEAESVACIVCSRLGLDTEEMSFAYIAGWSSEDISKFTKNVEVISNISMKIITSIDKHLHEHFNSKNEKEASKHEGDIPKDIYTTNDPQKSKTGELSL